MVLGLVGATSASASVKQWSWTLLHRQHQFTYYLSQASVIDVGMLDLQSCISFAHVRVQRIKTLRDSVKIIDHHSWMMP